MAQEREIKPRCPMCACTMEKRGIFSAVDALCESYWWCDACGDGFADNDRLAPDDDFAKSIKI